MVDELPPVISDPEIMSGQPCLAGTRIPARAIASFASAGYTVGRIIAEYPSLTATQIADALCFTLSRPAPASAGDAGEVEYLDGVVAPDRIYLLSHPHCGDTLWSEDDDEEAESSVAYVRAALNPAAQAPEASVPQRNYALDYRMAQREIEPNPPVAPEPDWQAWCEEWHRTVEVILTMAGLSPALSAAEAREEMQKRLTQAPEAGEVVVEGCNCPKDGEDGHHPLCWKHPRSDAHPPATPEQTNSTATNGGEPGEAQDVSPAHGATPQPGQVDKLREALDDIGFALQFAYKQGLHEFGYDPLAEVRAALANLATPSVATGEEC